MPEADDPKPENETQKPDAPKPNEGRADGGLARALDQIKSAEEDLARLDRLVSGMERAGEGPRASHASPGATAAATPANKAPDAGIPDTKPSNTRLRDQGVKRDRAMMRALAILVLAIGLLGAAVASQFGDEAKSIGKSISTSIMARWAPPAPSAPPQAAAVESPAQPPPVLLAAADESSPVPAPVAKETDSAAKPGAQAPDASSPDLAQSLKTITGELANINAKLEQVKSRNEQTQREQADTIQQLKAAQEKVAADNARLAAQVQALQTQPAAPSTSAPAKPVVRTNETAAPARPHAQAAAPRRPRPPQRGPWMPPPYMMDPYDPDW